MAVGKGRRSHAHGQQDSQSDDTEQAGSEILTPPIRMARRGSQHPPDTVMQHYDRTLLGDVSTGSAARQISFIRSFSLTVTRSLFRQVAMVRSVLVAAVAQAPPTSSKVDGEPAESGDGNRQRQPDVGAQKARCPNGEQHRQTHHQKAKTPKRSNPDPDAFRVLTFSGLHAFYFRELHAQNQSKAPATRKNSLAKKAAPANRSRPTALSIHGT